MVYDTGDGNINTESIPSFILDLHKYKGFLVRKDTDFEGIQSNQPLSTQTSKSSNARGIPSIGNYGRSALSEWFFRLVILIPFFLGHAQIRTQVKAGNEKNKTIDTYRPFICSQE